MNMDLKTCQCSGRATIISYFVKGIANHKNYFAKCVICGIRTRSRKNREGAIEDWNNRQAKGDGER